MSGSMASRDCFSILVHTEGTPAMTITVFPFCHQVTVVFHAPPVRTGVLSRDSENRQFSVGVADNTREVGL